MSNYEVKVINGQNVIVNKKRGSIVNFSSLKVLSIICSLLNERFNNLQSAIEAEYEEIIEKRKRGRPKKIK